MAKQESEVDTETDLTPYVDQFKALYESIEDRKDRERFLEALSVYVKGTFDESEVDTDESESDTDESEVDTDAGREVNVLAVGLDGGGKTTILYKLKLGEVVTTIPTIGFNVENIECRDVKFVVWDVGGQSKIRMLWRHYYQDKQVLLWVLDSEDRSRLAEELEMLKKMSAEKELRGVPLLIICNKIPRSPPLAADPDGQQLMDKICSDYGVAEMRKSRRVRIMAMNAVLDSPKVNADERKRNIRVRSGLVAQSTPLLPPIAHIVAEYGYTGSSFEQLLEHMTELDASSPPAPPTASASSSAPATVSAPVAP